jgi:hypothetical protein
MAIHRMGKRRDLDIADVIERRQRMLGGYRPRKSLRMRIVDHLMIGAVTFLVAVAFIAAVSWLGVTLNTINNP